MTERTRPQRVVVTDVRIPFGSAVNLLVTWALASVPAMLVLGLVGAMIGFLLTTLAQMVTH